MVGIYKITNKVNGKVYIGQSVNITARWTQHRTRPFREGAEQYNSPLYRAIRKYGLSNFFFEVIEETTKDKLDAKEINWIARYQSNDPEKGYNLTTGGSGTARPVVLNATQVEEIRELLMTSTLTEEVIANQYNVSQRTISGINLGQTWLKEGLNYPLKSYRQVKEKIFTCPICGGIKLSEKSSVCEKCAHDQQRRTKRPSREELKQLIRTTPFTRIAAQYGVSDTAIRKWCDAEHLPRKSSEIKKMTDEEWSKI